jgi:hypothetical protein
VHVANARAQARGGNIAAAADKRLSMALAIDAAIKERKAAAEALLPARAGLDIEDQRNRKELVTLRNMAWVALARRWTGAFRAASTRTAHASDAPALAARLPRRAARARRTVRATSRREQHECRGHSLNGPPSTRRLHHAAENNLIGPTPQVTRAAPASIDRAARFEAARTLVQLDPEDVGLSSRADRLRARVGRVDRPAGLAVGKMRNRAAGRPIRRARCRCTTLEVEVEEPWPSAC